MDKDLPYSYLRIVYQAPRDIVQELSQTQIPTDLLLLLSQTAALLLEMMLRKTEPARMRAAVEVPVDSLTMILQVRSMHTATFILLNIVLI